MPLLHPAAALRTPSLVETLQGDFAKLPALLQQEPPGARSEADEIPAISVVSPEAATDQLDLFA
jgi:hypothetical protein